MPKAQPFGKLESQYRHFSMVGYGAGTSIFPAELRGVPSRTSGWNCEDAELKSSILFLLANSLVFMLAVLTYSSSLTFLHCYLARKA